MLIYVIAYYLASLILAVYMDKTSGLDFVVKLNGRKFNRAWTLLLSSPLLVPVMVFELIKARKK